MTVIYIDGERVELHKGDSLVWYASWQQWQEYARA